jgi:hypothetical protein
MPRQVGRSSWQGLPVGLRWSPALLVVVGRVAGRGRRREAAV